MVKADHEHGRSTPRVGTRTSFPTFISGGAIDRVETGVMHMQNQEENNMPTYTVTVADSTGDTRSR